MPPEPGQRFAAFDVGTNTVQMAVAQWLGGRFEVLSERAEITRLGEGVNRTGELKPEAMERTASALARFSAEARALGVSQFAAAATSAVRDAANGAHFVRAARERAGVELEIISGEDEARLTFRAVQEDFGALAQTLVALDIGGGSTELIIGPARGAPAWRQSVNVGSVRLTEQVVSAHPIPDGDVGALRGRAREAMAGWPAAPADACIVAVAATATSLYALAERLPSEADPRVHGGTLQAHLIEPLVEDLRRMDLDARRAVRGMNPKRADVLCAGGYVLLEALARLGIQTCRVSDRGVRWGLLWERFGPRGES